MNIKTFPDCNEAACAACKDGRCVALTDNTFWGKKCPFFKTREQVAKERAYCKNRLAEMKIGK